MEKGEQVMKYILFRAEIECGDALIYDSIILTAPNNIEGSREDAVEEYGAESGYGHFKIHKSGGLIFDNLELLKQYTRAMWMFSAIDSTEEQEVVRNTANWVREDLKMGWIKFQMDYCGGLNVDLYEWEEGMEDEKCYQEYLHYKLLIKKENK